MRIAVIGGGDCGSDAVSLIDQLERQPSERRYHISALIGNARYGVRGLLTFSCDEHEQRRASGWEAGRAGLGGGRRRTRRRRPEAMGRHWILKSSEMRAFRQRWCVFLFAR